MTHTPTPWRVEENTDLIWGACNPDDTTTYGMGYPIVSGFASFGNWAAGRPDFNEKEANAAFIVTAVNTYDKHRALIETLVKALEKAEVLYRNGIVFSEEDFIEDVHRTRRSVLAAAKQEGF